MHLKHLCLTLAIAGMLSAQAYAHEAVSEAAPMAAVPVQEAAANALTQDDLVALFGAEEAGKPLQLAVLSQQEMRETEGAFSPYVGRMLIGGGAAFATSVYNQWDFNRGWRGYQSVNWGRAAGAAVIGAGFGAASRWMANRGWF